MPTGRYIILDLETTGLDPQLEGILEIAAVKLEHGRTGEVFHRLIRPSVEISPASQAIHGITDEMVADAPPIEAVLDELLAFLGDWPLVAHNAPFDLGFLNRALGLTGRPALTNAAYDTLEIAREVLPEQRSFKLESLCRLFGHEALQFHRAIDDAMHLAAIFPTLIGLYRQKQAWYRAQFERIEHIALRHEQLARLIETLQAEQGEHRRVLQHYFADHPEAKVTLPGGEALAWHVKENWDYDTERLFPLLAEWGLRDKFAKLDRPRLERWLTGSRLSDEQKALITETRLLLGQTQRLTRHAPKEPPPAPAEPNGPTPADTPTGGQAGTPGTGG
jgi:DNA polymerase III epsilon subunit